MRIAGKKIQGSYSKVVRLPRPDGSFWELEIQPLRLGFLQTLHERGIVLPNAPTKVSRDSTGKPIRDADGFAVVQRDESDLHYLEGIEKYHQRIATLVLWEGLQGDQNVEFDTVSPVGKEGWVLFADELHTELEVAGWTAGDLIWVCEQVSELSNLTGENFREAQQDFFSSAGTCST